MKYGMHVIRHHEVWVEVEAETTQEAIDKTAARTWDDIYEEARLAGSHNERWTTVHANVEEVGTVEPGTCGAWGYITVRASDYRNGKQALETLSSTMQAVGSPFRVEIDSEMTDFVPDSYPKG